MWRLPRKLVLKHQVFVLSWTMKNQQVEYWTEKLSDLHLLLWWRMKRQIEKEQERESVFDQSEHKTALNVRQLSFLKEKKKKRESTHANIDPHHTHTCAMQICYRTKLNQSFESFAP